MDVYTLTGKSGTGKSFHAMNLCKKYNIESIIDDGLFIYRNTVAEGVSAKRSSTKIGAVKTALFLNDEIRDKVVDAIKKKNPASILVLGTSDGMADRIIDRLGLPALEPDRQDNRETWPAAFAGGQPQEDSHRGHYHAGGKSYRQGAARPSGQACNSCPVPSA